MATVAAKATDQDLVIAHQSPGCVMATWKNVLIAIWGTQGTVALAAELRDASSKLASAHPEGFSSLHFIVDGTALPDSAAREELSRVAAQFAHQVACLGAVIDGRGFWASMMRSFVTSTVLFSRKPYKTIYAATIADLVRRVVGQHTERTGARLAAEDLERVFVDVRSRL